MMAREVRPVGRVVGVRGATWRATVDSSGTIHPHDGSSSLAWHVAGDDRWYSPTEEATTRQKWYSGFPVAETRMRVGGGDIVQRVYSVADLGGITVVEFENESTLPVAIALTRRDILTSREIPANPPQGIDLPAGSVALPLGHKSSMRVGISHVSPAAGRLPDDIAGYQAVVRGWETACDVASRLTLPDHTVVATVARLRSDILLGLEVPGSSIESVRLGETNRDSIIGVVETVQARLKSDKRSKQLAWDTPHMLATAARACVLLEDEVAAGDIGASWLRLADRSVASPPREMPAGVAAIAWAESLLAKGSPSGGSCDLFPWGIPETWLGASFDTRGLVADPYRTVSFAVRWHGARPALLWEVEGAPGLVLSASGVDHDWHTVEGSGETLLADPRTTVG